MRVLIAAPISGHKQYSINQWFDWIANQTHPDYDFALCVNGANQYKLISLLRQVEITDVHGQTKKPIILWNQVRAGVQTSRHHNIVHARESLRRYAVKHGYDKMLWLDTDTIPMNLRAIEMLHNTGKEAISGVYFYKGTRVPVMVSKATGTNFTLKELEDAVNKKELLEAIMWGLGIALIDKTVFEKIPFEYSHFGKEVGDDYGYCYAMQEAGIERFVQPLLLCHHLGEPMKAETIEINKD